MSKSGKKDEEIKRTLIIVSKNIKDNLQSQGQAIEILILPFFVVGMAM